MRQRALPFLALLTLSALVPSAALAHTGAGDTAGFSQGFMHPISGLDHVLAMVMVGILACLALILQRADMEVAARLVDPILVGLVVILTLGVPIRMAGRGLMALLKRAPAKEVVTSIEELVRGALADLPIRALYVRVVQPARTTYAMVHVLLSEAEAVS